jgi:hypothetical protein
METRSLEKVFLLVIVIGAVCFCMLKLFFEIGVSKLELCEQKVEDLSEELEKAK